MTYVITTFTPKPSIQNQLQSEFPTLNFRFFKSIEEAGDLLQKAEVIVTFGDDITEEVVNKAIHLKWIMVMSSGLENMPFQTLKRRGILLTNARGIHKIPMAEFALGLMLLHAKQFLTYVKQQENHNWSKNAPLKELYGSTLLVIGAGTIGKEIGKYAKFFGLRTIGINRSGNPIEEFDEVYGMDSLLTVLPEADYVISVLPSTKETKGIFTMEKFKAMKKEAVFINLGRGDSVNEKDLLEALNNAEFTHAYLDVFNEEPLPERHPFWNCERITITPHTSARSKMYLPRAMEIFMKNLRVFLDGGRDMINMIDLDRGY